MFKLISVGLIALSISCPSYATADKDPMVECVWDQYFTKIESLKKKKATTEVESMREQKRAFEVLKKEKFFDLNEGLKMVFPVEYEDCLNLVD